MRYLIWQVTFNGSWTTGSRIVSDSIPLDLASKVYKVQCFPLYSILVAVGQTTVDYFSLDVEGVELDILRTIPWDKVDIKVRIVTFKSYEQNFIKIQINYF